MNMTLDAEFLGLLAGVLILLTLSTLLGWWLRGRVRTESGIATVENLNARIRAWWPMVGVFGLAMVTGRMGSVVLFGVVSFFALREFITLAPTKHGDHRALFWVFFIITPLQYALVGSGWYGMFTLLIPVYAFLFVPLRSALSGDCERFLERSAIIQWGLMVCVYCVSHAPAIFLLQLPGGEVQSAKLVFFFVLVVQMSDVLQYGWGKTCGRHRIAPLVSPNKTWEGFLGGTASATALGAALWWATPFTPWQAAGMAFVSTLMGFAGGLVMSAVKRDLGVKDYGSLIAGHGGVMDRIDSICFAAPVFFHLTRFGLV